MKSSQLVIPTLTGLLGLALGFAMAPSILKSETASEASSATARRNPSSEVGGLASDGDWKSSAPKRARERGEATKPKEPRISLPLKTVVGILKGGEFQYNSEFDDLSSPMEIALSLLGATDREREEVLNLVKKSKEEILVAEKSHLKLGEVTADKIHIDKSGMKGPAEEIVRRTQDGIRAALPADLAEGLVSAINWEKYYPASPTSAKVLEITRSGSGKLTAWQRDIGGGGIGNGLGGDVVDDGTPIPADKVFKGSSFGDRWAPFIKGLTLLPRDEE